MQITDREGLVVFTSPVTPPGTSPGKVPSASPGNLYENGMVRTNTDVWNRPGPGNFLQRQSCRPGGLGPCSGIIGLGHLVYGRAVIWGRPGDPAPVSRSLLRVAKVPLLRASQLCWQVKCDERKGSVS